jgi:hypothetical protein
MKRSILLASIVIARGGLAADPASAPLRAVNQWANSR